MASLRLQFLSRHVLREPLYLFNGLLSEKFYLHGIKTLLSSLTYLLMFFPYVIAFTPIG